ncbi:MAG: hypothetical protein K5695_07435 [Oscillospiraceae bacterium]|nr:hypothetical protein [Oscillospiraceae bacterium]
MKRKYLFALLCMTAVLGGGCAQVPEASSEVSELPVQTETTESPAATEVPATEEAVTEAPTSEDASAETNAADSLSDAKNELREKEETARLQVEYEKKHSLYTENGGIMVEDATSWQDGYAQLLESGDAVYLLTNAPTEQPDLFYALLHVDDSDIPNLVVSKGGSYQDVLFFRYEDSKVVYAGTCWTDQYDMSFYYRPYRGDVACNSGSVMAEGVYTTFWHLGESEMYSYAHNGYNDEQTTATLQKVADRFDVTVTIEKEYEVVRCMLGSSWVAVTPDSSGGVFKPVTPDTIALLYNEEEGGTP